MYALNENQQAVESRGQIRDALLDLMRDIPYQEISITQICRRANVVRQTYYRNFEFKGDILAYHLDGLFKQFFESCYRGHDMGSELVGFFNFMLLQREFLSLAVRNDLFSMLNRTITENITRFLSMAKVANVDDPRAERFVTGFIASTVCSLLSLWAEHDFEETSEWMSALASRFLAGLEHGGVPVDTAGA